MIRSDSENHHGAAEEEYQYGNNLDRCKQEFTFPIDTGRK